MIHKHTGVHLLQQEKEMEMKKEMGMETKKDAVMAALLYLKKQDL